MSAGAPGAFVIGADQLLVCGDEWFDKPVDVADARGQLQRLRGRRHTLVTAVSVVRDGAEIWGDLACPALTMRPFSDAFLERYLECAGDGILGCVGGYEAEGLGAQLLAEIEGDWFAVLGLPLLPFVGVSPRARAGGGMILSGAARLAGVMGWPVAHSRSPRIHGYWLEENEIDGGLPATRGPARGSRRGARCAARPGFSRVQPDRPAQGGRARAHGYAVGDRAPDRRGQHRDGRGRRVATRRQHRRLWLH